MIGRCEKVWKRLPDDATSRGMFLALLVIVIFTLACLFEPVRGYIIFGYKALYRAWFIGPEQW